jgi:DNA-binding MarR family transcriptional regulator
MGRPFTIPGVTLEEVLGACKAEHGRALYSLAAAAAKDLADYVRERRDDGDLELVELPPGAPAADPPSAAGAPPPPPSSTDDLEALLTDTGRNVLDALRAVAGEWRKPRELAALLDVDVSRLTRALRDLRLTRLVEHNGLLRQASAFRVPAAPTLEAGLERARRGLKAAAAAERGDEAASIVEDLREERAALRAQAAASTPPVDQQAAGPPISRRVRRELEAEQERQRREAERPPATNGAGTLDGQALHELAFRPATIPELAGRLRITPREAAAVIRRLEDDGDLERRGRRSGEIIYGGVL